MKKASLSLIGLCLGITACMPSQCDYKDGELVAFNNPDSLGISFMAHGSFEPHLFKEQAFEKDNGDVIEFGTQTGKGVNEFATELYQFATMIPGAELDKVEQGSRDGFDYHMYQNDVARKEHQQQLSLYIGNDTLVSSVIVTYSKADGGCKDAAMEILNSVTLNLDGYKAPFVPPYMRDR